MRAALRANGCLRRRPGWGARGTNMTIQFRTLLGVAFAAAASIATAQVTAMELNGSGATPRARQMLEQVPDLAYSPDAIIVRFKSDSTPSQRASVRASVGGQQLRGYPLVPGMELMSAPQGINATIAALRNNPAVLYSEPDYVIRTTATPDDPQYSSMWGLNAWNNIDINAAEAWDTFTGDANFVIAVIDTGTQLDHPDLQANIWTNTREVPNNGVDDDGNGYVDDVHGWNFYDHNNNPSDDNGHGTHTAGTIGAVGNNGMGVTGVNWRCKIMPLRFIGSGGGYESDALAAIQYAFRNGAKVSNNSWGSTMYMQGVYDAIAQSKQYGHLFVAAAGNSGFSMDVLPFYPAGYDLDNIVSVAAIDNSGALCTFSNFSPTQVDLAAPGENIVSLAPYGGWTSKSGTSMAAPHVAGVAALVWARNAGATYQQIRDRLLSTTRPLASLIGKCATGGLLDAAKAVQVATNTPPQITITAPSNGGTATAGNSVYLAGAVYDREEGDISSRTVWSSDYQGYLGTGASFYANLSPGTHRITAAVTDNGGATSQTSIVFYVQNPNSVPLTPTIQTISVDGTNLIRITWRDNSTNETTFEIQREQRGPRYWKYTTTAGVVGANVTSFSDRPGLGTYHYRVRAVNATGASSWSDWIMTKVN
jgi:subtilisin family serine protease